MSVQRVRRSHSDDPVGAVASPDAVETLQEADKAVQQHPVPAAPQPGACPLPIHVPVAFAVRHPPSPSSRQQQEASPPELQRVDQAEEGGGTESPLFDLDAQCFSRII